MWKHLLEIMVKGDSKEDIMKGLEVLLSELRSGKTTGEFYHEKAKFEYDFDIR